MTTELDRECPECETERSFYRSASTHLQLGEKTKWHCPECDFGLVCIGGDVRSA